MMVEILGMVAALWGLNSDTDKRSAQPVTTAADFAWLKWVPGTSQLDLKGYAQVWSDEFDRCDIGEDRGFLSKTPDQPDAKSLERHSWYTTPQTFYLAKFMPPDARPSPYACAGGLLNITLSNPTGRQWQSGILSATSSAGRGYTRGDAFSYFEARIRLPVPPHGIAPWPAFWFLNTHAPKRSAEPILEVDVIEPGLVSPDDLTLQATSLHQWPAFYPKPGDLTQHRLIGYNDHYVTFDGRWHTYGLLRTPRWFIMYMDGHEQRRIPSLRADMRVPIYPILDLALKYPPKTGTDVKYTMSVDYVRAYVCTPARGGDAQCAR